MGGLSAYERSVAFPLPFSILAAASRTSAASTGPIVNPCVPGFDTLVAAVSWLAQGALHPPASQPTNSQLEGTCSGSAQLRSFLE